eukprot:TRINITY_DN11879_c0_g1_i1.p1 TRINITY_DN11879_c0_g1~~TRINITY_DN11879_c0_g1_i1.p1  ORF type:complete len:542 (-),score=179.73 TRINITY_DN11879_c0_g1_i1:252-1877(-)
MASVAFDEYGRPVIILKEQDQKARVRGLEAHKQNIAAARTVADLLRTSLGPRGMDKMLVSQDGDVTITNDGATIVEKIDVGNEIARLVVELSKAQDEEIGDGTTGVVVLAGALLRESETLLDRGIHPLRIAEGLEKGCEIACNELHKISERFPYASRKDTLREIASSSLNSKIVNRVKGLLSEVVVDAILSVANVERGDVNLDLIKVEAKTGGDLADTRLVRGIVLDKDFSHHQMTKTLTNPRIAVITCPFEPPKPKTKHKVDVASAEDYRKLHEIEQQYFRDQVDKCKEVGSDLVICQWGFDDEANHLLLAKGLNAVRWVGGVELELIAIATGARIVPRFEEMDAKKLGTAGTVREVQYGTTKDRMLFIEDCPGTKAVTIFVRGGNQMVLEEAKRSIHDALCTIRNIVRDPTIVYGGGSAEIACAGAVRKASDTTPGVEQYAVRAFADALDTIPHTLAENSGLPPVESLSEARKAQKNGASPHMGVDCMQTGTMDMKEQGVYECLSSKVQQFRLATQVVKMILKIDDVILTGQAGPEVVG